MPDNKIAIVTGGSRGIGRNTVLCLARRGIRTIFTYNSNRAEADKVAVLANKAGSRAIALQLDTGNTGAFDGFVTELRAALSELRAERFDYLVNNAGTSSSASLEVDHGSGDGCALQRPLQGRAVPDAKAAATHARRRPYREYFLRPRPFRHAQPHRIRFDQGGCRSADALHGRGTGAAPHCGERRRTGCHRHRFRRRRDPCETIRRSTRPSPTTPHSDASAYPTMSGP